MVSISGIRIEPQKSKQLSRTKGQNQRFALQELLRNSRWHSTTLRAFSYARTKWTSPLCASPHNCICNLPLCGDRILAELFYINRKLVSYNVKKERRDILFLRFPDSDCPKFRLNRTFPGIPGWCRGRCHLVPQTSGKAVRDDPNYPSHNIRSYVPRCRITASRPVQAPHQ